MGQCHWSSARTQKSTIDLTKYEDKTQLKGLCKLQSGLYIFCALNCTNPAQLVMTAEISTPKHVSLPVFKNKFLALTIAWRCTVQMSRGGAEQDFPCSSGRDSVPFIVPPHDQQKQHEVCRTSKCRQILICINLHNAFHLAAS